MDQRGNCKNDERIVCDDADAGLGPSEPRSFSASTTTGGSSRPGFTAYSRCGTYGIKKAMMFRSIRGMERGITWRKGRRNAVCDAHLVTRQVSSAEVSLAPPQADL